MRVKYLDFFLIALLASVVLLAGCKSTLLVHDAQLEKIIPILDDYAGTHGYQITYRNDEAGSFRLSLGNVYVPAVSETTKSKSVIVQPPPEGSNLPMTSYEDTTMRTVSSPGRYVEAYAMISLIQQDKDVQIIIDSNDAGGASPSDLIDYIRSFGYVVDNR